MEAMVPSTNSDGFNKRKIGAAKVTLLYHPPHSQVSSYRSKAAVTGESFVAPKLRPIPTSRYCNVKDPSIQALSN